MPKGKKRNEEEYEKEIADAAKRMAKRPEHLRAARDSDDWIDFLDSIGITTAEAPFWEQVREKVTVTTTGYTVRRMAEARVEVVAGVYRDVRGHFTSEPTGEPVVSYRDVETGRFVSRKTIESR